MGESFKFKWINEIKSKQGPEASMTRLVLMILSSHMNNSGGNCFPSTRLLAEESALSERSVCTHLEKAEQTGWIKKQQRGISGQGWKRNEYVPVIPEKALKELQHVNDKGTESDEKGTESDDKKALKEVQLSISESTSESIPYSLSQLLLDLILARRNTFKKPNIASWSKEIEKMLRIDKRDPAEIERVIRWCQADNFWQNNVLSTKKLRQQYDALAMKMSSDKSKTKMPNSFSLEGYKGDLFCQTMKE